MGKGGRVHHRELVVLIAAIAVVSLTPVPAAGQTARDWTPPRTADGQPDLQDVWLSNGATPLERPAALADRATLTDEEVATLQARADRIFKDGRSAFAVPATTFRAAFENVDKYLGESTSSSIGMVDMEFGRRTSLVVSPPDGRIPTLTPEAQRRADAVDTGWRYKTGPEDLSNIHRCITTGVPRLGGNFGAGPYSYYQIVQTPGYVVLIMEAYHDARIIPLDGRPHLSNKIRQWNGDSRGHWEGDTLVIDTRNFSSNSYFQGAAEGMHLVERFTRTAPDTLTYEMSFSDPTTWATSWTAEMRLKRMEQSIYEFACHEGNHSLIGMLRTARLEDDR